jgi:hypothetical protein
MDIDQERTDLQHFVEGHQQRIHHLRARIDRSTRELRLHEMIKGLAENSQLPEAMRSLAEMTGVASATSSEVRDFLAERGVSVSTELDISVRSTGDDFSVLATYRDDWFPAELSWSTREGFQGRIVNNTWRELQATAQAEDV